MESNPLIHGFSVKQSASRVPRGGVEFCGFRFSSIFVRSPKQKSPRGSRVLHSHAVLSKDTIVRSIEYCMYMLILGMNYIYLYI